MTHLPTPAHSSLRRTLATVATTATLMLVGALGGCLQPPEADSGDLFANLADVDCSGVAEWKQNDVYPAGTRVTDTGLLFESRATHQAFAPNWNPKSAASLWVVIGTCVNGGGGQQPPPAEEPPAEEPPAEEPPAEEPPAQEPPPNNGGGGGAACEANGRPGPLFDVAGDKNVGNGQGQQFIGGQCLSNDDCASGCCANPCGICSGVGAQFQAGKQGCGFVD